MSGGDLIVNNAKCECKSFTSNAPISFGPTEKWDKIIFLDAREWHKDNFVVIQVNLKSDDDDWVNIYINKKETFEDQYNQKRRPRINWSHLDKQINKKNKEIIFKGTLQYILNI